MTAGSPAGAMSRRELLLEEKHERAAAHARRAEARAHVATHAERDVERALTPLRAIGFHLLPRRGWPGSRNAQVDLIVVGPSGLFVVDTTSWSDVTIEGGRVFRTDVDVTEDLAGLADLAYATEAVMAEIGLAPGEIHPVVVLAGRSGTNARVGTVEMVGETDAARYIVARGTRLTPAQVERVVEAALEFFPVVEGGAHGRPITSLDALDEDGQEESNFDTIPLLSNVALTRQLEAGLAAPRVDGWMSFPGAEEARLVRRSFNGPSRIRGAAGTGKTVVALHRAAYLARTQPGIVLVTSFVSTLPAVQSSLMKLLAPDISGRIEFVGTHAFAKRLLSDRGIRVNLQPAIADAEFELVWRTMGRLGVLGRLEPKATYWEDEIEHVIKGRGIQTFEQYAELNRTGRRRGLNLEQRRAVWELFTAYQTRMNARGAHDEADLILLAEQSLLDRPLERYGSVIVDEAQDLSSAMIRMLHHLVGNKPDGLTLVGDGQQTIYPGGYTLGEVGISLAGRGVVMTTNYRNTTEILEFARSLVAGDEFNDIEGASEHGDSVTTVARSGPDPLIVRFSNRATHDAELPRRIREMVSDTETRFGDIGILTLTTFGVRAAISALNKANIPVVELTNYDGRPVDAVKVGTVKRAKGLEFKQVLLAQVPLALLPAEDTPPPHEEGAAAEHTELQRRELYVAMTRAREGLWIGTVP